MPRGKYCPPPQFFPLSSGLSGYTFSCGQAVLLGLLTPVSWKLFRLLEEDDGPSRRFEIDILTDKAVRPVKPLQRTTPGGLFLNVSPILKPEGRQGKFYY
jgi:hypothetical protein